MENKTPRYLSALRRIPEKDLLVIKSRLLNWPTKYVAHIDRKHLLYLVDYIIQDKRVDCDITMTLFYGNFSNVAFRTDITIRQSYRFFYYLLRDLYKGVTPQGIYVDELVYYTPKPPDLFRDIREFGR